MTPLARACKALRLPRGLYLFRGELPLADAEIRANVRRASPFAFAGLVTATAETFRHLAGSEDAADVWPVAAACVDEAGLPASLIGVVVGVVMASGETVESDEWTALAGAAP